MYSTVGSVLSQEERAMIKLPPFQFSVAVGIILSDGCCYLAATSRSINRSLRFSQSLEKSSYVWFVFFILSNYCFRLPYIVKGERAGKQTRGLEFYTLILPCFQELYKIFYPESIKIIPENIY